MSEIRMHEDHAALCLCCRHIYLERGFPGSDITAPGEDYYHCRKNLFNGYEDPHKWLAKAQACPKYEAREKAIPVKTFGGQWI